ncbi:hypothetical protein GCM10010985_60750 [Caballeronia grimmiae]|uniref:Transposase n=1 Tax=Caballeronia grimmiae TaxID=1071679 RepID=A0ABQ1SBC4_9BURK|nr:hypothetical protein GCM10010985_60750 [Caballeronia grimmiae]
MRSTVQRFSSRSTSQSEIGRGTESGERLSQLLPQIAGRPSVSVVAEATRFSFTTFGVLAFSTGSVATPTRNFKHRYATKRQTIIDATRRMRAAIECSFAGWKRTVE